MKIVAKEMLTSLGIQVGLPFSIRMDKTIITRNSLSLPGQLAPMLMMFHEQ